jgi:hypothetical protein
VTLPSHHSGRTLFFTYCLRAGLAKKTTPGIRMSGGSSTPESRMTSADLLQLLSQVLERSLQKSGFLPAPPPNPDVSQSAADLVVDSMADKLLSFIAKADASAQQSTGRSTADDELTLRNQRLARAIGACSCFGGDPTCANCTGKGRPGWVLPDRAEFEEFIRPALRKVSEVRQSFRGAVPHSPAHWRTNGRDTLA